MLDSSSEGEAGPINANRASFLAYFARQTPKGRLEVIKIRSNSGRPEGAGHGEGARAPESSTDMLNSGGHSRDTPHLSGRLEVRSELAAVTRADVARLTLYRLTLSAGAIGWRCRLALCRLTMLWLCRQEERSGTASAVSRPAQAHSQVGR